MLFNYKKEFTSGIISTIIALFITYIVSFIFPTGNLRWALTAVGIASFFSAFFTHYFVVKNLQKN